MPALRALLFARPALAAVILALALAARLLIPAGTMPASGVKSFTVLLCADANRGPTQVQLALPVETEPGQDRHGGKDGPACGFAGLAMPALAGADPVLLALALAFVLALGFAAEARPASFRRTRWRPPLRAPPVLFSRP